MNYTTIIKAVLLVTLTSITSTCLAQGGGLQLYAGGLASLNTLEQYTEADVTGGLVIGADARLLGGGLHILIGGRYGMIAGGADDFTMTTGRIGIGFTLFKISDRLLLRSKIAGSIHFTNGFEASTKPNSSDPYLINDSFAGGVAGLGIDIGILTIDLEYEYGLVNAINREADTTMDFVSLTAGVFF